MPHEVLLRRPTSHNQAPGDHQNVCFTIYGHTVCDHSLHTCDHHFYICFPCVAIVVSIVSLCGRPFHIWYYHDHVSGRNFDIWPMWFSSFGCYLTWRLAFTGSLSDVKLNGGSGKLVQGELEISFYGRAGEFLGT